MTPHYKTRDSIHQERKSDAFCRYHYQCKRSITCDSVIQNEDSRIKYFQLIARMALNRGKDYQVKFNFGNNWEGVLPKESEGPLLNIISSIIIIYSQPKPIMGKTFFLNRNNYRQLVASLTMHHAQHPCT